MKFFNLKKKKILVVEDEPDIAEGIEARLELAGYAVVRAGNGQEGVELARAKKPDLVILDLMIPRLDGFEVCHILKTEEKTKKIPILVLTALQMVSDVEKAFSQGADQYLTKPFSNDRLLEKVQLLLCE